ncbi:MAG: host-nuclease inhibitor Gam family protein [Armatimonadetes bacterium]|nr:host-nuclease inhibitor Gam family protein [Armatimonadota bacterium]
MMPDCQSWSDADALLARLGQIERQIKRAEADAEARMKPIRDELASTVEPLETERQAILQSLESFCRAHRAEFAGKKSRQLAHGSVGFRISKKLVLLPGWTWDAVLDALKKARRHNLIRRIEEPNKDALKRLDPDRQRQYGVAVEETEHFWAKPAE